jgi:hypothetical protein
MKPVFRTLIVAVTLASAGIGAAYAQSTTGAGANPAQRGPRDSFFYGPLNGGTQTTTLGNSIDGNLLKRPKDGGRAGAVTPVPEPSQWAMMLAGLALVGFIVKRRNGAR